jgi:hypothetical protein
VLMKRYAIPAGSPRYAPAPAVARRNGPWRGHCGRRWSQVVAVASGLPANVVAVWSQSGLSDSASNPVAGPLSCGFAGAPRGIRTPNRQIRSLVTGGPPPTSLDSTGATPVDGVVDVGECRSSRWCSCPRSGAATRVVEVRTSSNLEPDSVLPRFCLPSPARRTAAR